MANPPRDRRSKRSLSSAVFRALALAIALGAAFYVLRSTPLAEHFDGDRLGTSLKQLSETVWAAPVLILLYVVLAPLGVPITPLIFAGGAVFGVYTGWLLNWIGAILGGLATYLIGRSMGRDLILHLVSERNLRRAEATLEEHGFWAIVRIRFLPIPFALVNYGAALVGVRLPTFLGATSLGLAPALVVYTTLSYALVGAADEDRMSVAFVGGLAIVGLLVLTFLPALLRFFTGERSDS